MSNENIWADLDQPEDTDLSRLLKKSSMVQFSSKSPLEKIRKNLVVNITLGLLICAVYVFLLVSFPLWQVQLCICIVLLFSLWAVYTAYQQYKNLDQQVSISNNLLAELKRNYDTINLWMNTQQRIALFIYPVSAAGGFMLGGALGSNKPIAVFMQKPIVVVVLIMSIAVLVPVCWYGAKWMFKISFGKHLKALKENIDALEAEG